MAGAFNTEAYSAQYGPALSDIAGFTAASNAGAVDATDPDTGQSTLGGYDADQENNIAKANATGGAAQVPSPFQQQRMMSGLNPPQPPKQGAGGSGATGPSSSGAFYDPNGPQASAPVHHAVSQLSDDQAKVLAKDIDQKVAAGQDQHGVPDLNTLWKHTYESEIEASAGKLKLDGDAADRAMNPTWRDKLAMMMDAANRASIVQGQNPALSKGQAWALATRGALDGWMARAQGMHEGYAQEQAAFLQQAHKDADEAVKRASDQFGLQQKADDLIEKRRHNQADEANNAVKDKAAADKDKREGAKGDLVTLEDGSLARVGADGKSVPVLDKQGNPVKGQKTGTKTPADTDAAARKNAEGSLDKIMQSIDKEEAAKAKDPSHFGEPPMSTEDKRARAMEILRTQDPKAYKALKGDDDDTGAPAPAPKGKTPAWYKPPNKS